MTYLKKATGLLLAALVSMGAQAHTDEYFDTVKGPNGGQVRMAGIYHFELVLVQDNPTRSKQPVRLYVSDHGDQPKASAGATAQLVIISGKQKSSVTLTPAGNNVLAGEAEYVSSADLQAVVQVTMPGEGHGPINAQAKFTPFKSVAATESDTKPQQHDHSHHH